MSDFLPDEVVVEILLRLPAKTLIQFRCVSKSWNSLIASPIFINSHLLNPKNNPPLAIVRHCESAPNARTERYRLFLDTEQSFDHYQELVFPLKSRRNHFYWLIGYAKGLFCLFEQDHYYLWNPSIRKSLTLPKPCITTKTHGRFVNIGLGFGFDPRTKDYKLVRLPLLCGTKPSEEAKVPLIVVYSLNSGTWKINSGAGDSFPQPSDSCPSGITISYTARFAAYLEGAVHFAAESRCGSSNVRMILSFDLHSELFLKMMLPNGMVSPSSEMSTSVFRGLLSLLCYDKGEGNNSCSIWMMKEYGVVDSWCKQFKVDLSGGIDKVVGIRNNGHMLVETKSKYSQFSSYDPCSQQLTNLGIHHRSHNFHVDSYEENLILLNKTYDATSGWGVSRKRKDRAHEGGVSDIRSQMKQAMRDEYMKMIDHVSSRIDSLEAQVAVYTQDTGPSKLSEASLSTTAKITPQLTKAMMDDFKAQFDEIKGCVEFLKSKRVCADGFKQVPGVAGVCEK